jgi:HD-GYP domain-containing protein (c-di-GMP phosphodiesterase class II)
MRMTPPAVLTPSASPAPAWSPMPLPEVLARIEALREENEALAREVLRCYEQLNLIFEMTAHIASHGAPEAIEELLIRRIGAMLDAEVFFSAPAGPELQNHSDPPDDERFRRIGHALREELAGVCRERRGRVPRRLSTSDGALRAGHVLLAPLGVGEAERVLIAVRRPAAPPFDSSDLLAAEAALSYGGHILANARMLRSLHQTAYETVSALANAIDAKDNYTCGHSERVGWLAHLIGAELQLDGAQLQVLEWAGLLHDVGKIGVPESILNKPGRLTPDEFAEIQKHPQRGHDVLRPVKRFEPVLAAVLHHHENHDGSGYPAGLAGEQIPLTARIIHVADIFDALTSDRPYRAGHSLEQACAIMEAEAGTVTDPRIVVAFLAAFRRALAEPSPEFRERFRHLRFDSPTGPAAAAEAAQAARPAAADTPAATTVDAQRPNPEVSR